MFYTNSQVKIDYEKITKKDIFINDIAHGLSHLCRFSGQCDQFYSVAQHSLAGAEFLLFEKNNPKLAKAFLLHDASEAYMSDIPSPLKDLLPEYEAIEKKVMKKIFQRFNVDYNLMEEIKETDKISSVIEAGIIFDCVPPWAKIEIDSEFLGIQKRIEESVKSSISCRKVKREFLSFYKLHLEVL